MTFRTIKLTELKKGFIFDSEENPHAPTLVFDTISKTFVFSDSSGRNMIRFSRQEGEYLIQALIQILETE